MKGWSIAISTKASVSWSNSSGCRSSFSVEISDFVIYSYLQVVRDKLERRVLRGTLVQRSLQKQGFHIHSCRNQHSLERRQQLRKRQSLRERSKRTILSYHVSQWLIFELTNLNILIFVFNLNWATTEAIDKADTNDIWYQYFFLFKAFLRLANFHWKTQFNGDSWHVKCGRRKVRWENPLLKLVRMVQFGHVAITRLHVDAINKTANYLIISMICC